VRIINVLDGEFNTSSSSGAGIRSDSGTGGLLAFGASSVVKLTISGTRVSAVSSSDGSGICSGYEFYGHSLLLSTAINSVTISAMS
jgi:hypothetical protein